MDPSQPQPAKKKVALTNPGGISLPSYAVMCLNLTLAVDAITLVLYVFLGTGDELSCGTLSARQTCYLPGVDWLGYALVACTVLTLLSMSMLAKTNPTK